MTPNEVLQVSMKLYEDNLKNKLKLSGRQVLFVDDSQAMLNLIDIMLKNKYNVLEGYIIEPNPVFAKHTLDWLINKGIELKEIIKCAVLDIDFGIYNKDITVNDLIHLFLTNDIPVILFSAVKETHWTKYVNGEYHDKVQYIDKTDAHAMNKIYTIITENEAVEL